MNNLTRKLKLHDASASLVATLRLAIAGLASLLLMAAFTPSAAAAQFPRQGKVLVVRGALSIFSLGLDELGSKLRRQGCDVVVSTSATSSLNAAVIIEEKRRNPQMPVILVGHSRGGLLAPELAKQFGQAGMKVDLVVIIDNTHKITMPTNVRRTVNLYHTNMFGVMHGLQVKGLRGGGQILNVNVKNIPGRDKAGYLDHFNIEESPWIHNIVINEVLKFAPIRPEVLARMQQRKQMQQNRMASNQNKNNQNKNNQNKSNRNHSNQQQPQRKQPQDASRQAVAAQKTPPPVYERQPATKTPQRHAPAAVQLAPATTIRQPQSISSLPVKRASVQRRPVAVKRQKTTARPARANSLHQRYAQQHPAKATAGVQASAARPSAPKRIDGQAETRAARPVFEYGITNHPNIVVE